jgi:hypothetical protein
MEGLDCLFHFFIRAEEGALGAGCRRRKNFSGRMAGPLIKPRLPQPSTVLVRQRFGGCFRRPDFIKAKYFY